MSPFQRRHRWLLGLALLLTACHDTGADHAQTVAARVLPRRVRGLRSASLHAYRVGAGALGTYLRDKSMPAGYLVTYECEAALPTPHLGTFAAFVNSTDSVSEFVPERNLGLFAQDYGVDYRMQ